MNGTAPGAARRWPRSLFGRVTLILFFGLVAAHGLSLGLIVYERAVAVREMMVAYLARDVASSVAILERVPARERASWLPKLERKSYRYSLETPVRARPAPAGFAAQVAGAITREVGAARAVTALTPDDGSDTLLIHLKLEDGASLLVRLALPKLPVSSWMLVVLLFQLALLGGFSWLAVRLATRPLAELARAADQLGPGKTAIALPEDGPMEVARAAAAFNAMQRRIAGYVAERVQILAAISHDLQTPLTRMRLRTDLMDDATQRDKFQADLDAMQALVQEGIAYARGVDGIAEPPFRTDVDALLDSIACDYADEGKPIRFAGRLERPLVTRPNALRRVVTNLVDNALKFGNDVELLVGSETEGGAVITVRDRGPGIPEGELAAVLEPFYRVETSRNRKTGGTGLGLAIARQLTTALEGTLTLANRAEGGLEVRVRICSLRVG